MRRRRLVGFAAATVAAGIAGAFVATRVTPESSSPAPATNPGDATRLRRFIRLDEAVQEFGSLGGPVVWSPDGRRLCVEQTTRAGERTVTIFSTTDWSRICQFNGSRPVWAPDGRTIAAVEPFPATVPPPANTAVVIIDPDTGVERSRTALPATSLGWSSDQLYGIVAGRVVKTTDPVPEVITCAGGCELAYWSTKGNYVVVATHSESPLYELHDLQRTPTVTEVLGNARAIVWATASPALAWISDDRIRTWSPEQGMQVSDIPLAYKPVVWSPKGDLLIAAHANRDWKQWRPGDHELSKVAMPIDVDLNSLVSWSPDGRFVAATPATYSTLHVRIHPVAAE
jgi:WD40 repeat protein